MVLTSGNITITEKARRALQHMWDTSDLTSEPRRIMSTFPKSSPPNGCFSKIFVLRRLILLALLRLAGGLHGLYWHHDAVAVADPLLSILISCGLPILLGLSTLVNDVPKEEKDKPYPERVLECSYLRTVSHELSCEFPVIHKAILS